MSLAESNNNFYDLSEDMIDLFNKILEEKSLPFDIKIKFQGNSKQKVFVKLAKISDQYAHLLDADLLVSMNEDFFYKLDASAQQILIEEELDRVVVNMDTGKLKLIKLDFTTSTGMIMKHGADEIMRSKGLENLTQQQKADSDRELETV